MRCFALIGPAASGKSTLLDRLAALGGDHDPAADGTGLRAVSFRFMGEPWCGLDCPGGAEALERTRQALMAADLAVVCVPPDPDDALLAAPYLRAVQEAGTPTILFINKIDEPRGRVRDIVAALQDYTSHVIVLRQVPIREGGKIVGAVDLVSERAWRYRKGEPSALVEIPEDALPREKEARSELLEHLSEFDDHLLEELVEDQEPPQEEIYAICARTVRDNSIVPALIGSAAEGAGARRLMKALRHEAPDVSALGARLSAGVDTAVLPLAAAFHAEHRRHLGKVTWLRTLGAGVAAGGRLAGGNLGALSSLGPDRKIDGALSAGGVAVALKADQLHAGTIATGEATLPPPAWAKPAAPSMFRVIRPDSARDDAKLAAALARLAEVDPGLSADREEETGALLAGVQGPGHLADVLRTLNDEFGVSAHEGAPFHRFRETIARGAAVHHRHRKQTGGAGQFADVSLTVAPNPRGTGFTFDETVKGGAVPRNYIPAVEAGAREAMARGPLCFPVIDVAVTLTDGRAHSVDSSDFAFRTAARAATLKALGEAEPVLLQPIHRVTFRVPSVLSGALVPLVATLKGRVLGFDHDPHAKGWDVFEALLPASALDGLALALRGATQGVGDFVATFDHFEAFEGRDADQVLTERARLAASA